MFFGDMFGDLGGFPNHRANGNQEPVDNEKLYKTLGVSKTATVKEIKTAYRKAALEHHPDRGGDEDKFKEVEKAKEILLDPKKRSLYDRYGEKGVEQGGGGGGAEDLLDFFTGGGRRQKSDPAKPKPINQTIDITLEDVYKGSAIKRKWKIKSATKKYHCTPCNGQGSVRQLVRQGPMMLQTQRKCDQCKGRGFKLPDEKEIQKSGTVHIPHGIKNGGKITLSGEGHNVPGATTGDVIFTVRLKKHKIYHRKGADLGCGHTLTLCEALCGYQFKLKHVSGKTLIIKSKPDEVVQPGDLKVLSDFGLPQKGNHFVHGHLYIQFKVVFPLATSLSTEKLSVLESVLKDVKYPDIVQVTELGQGSRVRVKLAANAAEKIYGRRKEMTAFGIIADEVRDDGASWPVEMDPIDEDGEPRLVVVPASWIEAHDEGQNSSSAEKQSKKKKGTQKSSSNSSKVVDESSQDENEEDYEDEEEVFLETVVGEPPKPTPAQGGSVHDEDEQDHQQGGVQCQQM